MKSGIYVSRAGEIVDLITEATTEEFMQYMIEHLRPNYRDILQLVADEQDDPEARALDRTTFILVSERRGVIEPFHKDKDQWAEWLKRYRELGGDESQAIYVPELN